MDYLEHLNNFEIFKIANELAVDIYPIEYEEKDERDMLIDFKDVLRKAIKSKSKVIAHEKANNLLKFMNPKRKWPWQRLETFNYIYEIEPNYEIFSNLLFSACFNIENINEELIYKYLIISEVYDRSVLNFLFQVYDLEVPELSHPFEEAEEEFEFSEEDLKAAKKLLKTGDFKPSNTPILLNKNIKIMSDDLETDIDDILNDDIDIDDIDLDIDELEELEEIELDESFEDEDFE